MFFKGSGGFKSIFCLKRFLQPKNNLIIIIYFSVICRRLDGRFGPRCHQVRIKNKNKNQVSPFLATATKLTKFQKSLIDLLIKFSICGKYYNSFRNRNIYIFLFMYIRISDYCIFINRDLIGYLHTTMGVIVMYSALTQVGVYRRYPGSRGMPAG